MRSFQTKVPQFLAASVAAWLLSATSVAQAQTPYVVSHSSGGWSPISGGTVHPPIAYSFFGAWDEGAAAISLPFDFTWYGNTYSTVHAYTNGFVSFGAPPANSGVIGPPSAFPQAPGPSVRVHDFIGVMWADLEGGSNPEIMSLVSGPSGSRVFTIQYKGLRRYGSPTSAVNFQIKLYEGSSSVEIVMGPNNGVTGASTGIENFDGTEGQNLLAAAATCGSACVCTPQNCGSANWPAGLTIAIALPNGAELIGSIRGPRGAYPGNSFDAVATIRNIGLQSAGAFDYEIRLSPSATSTDSSTLLLTESVAGLAASNTFTATRTVTMPAGTPVGTYYLAIVADSTHTVGEIIEANNRGFDARGVATAPDLVASVNVPAQSGPGEDLDIALTVASQGAPVADSLQVTFHLSPDATLDSTDTLLDARVIAMPDGFTFSDTITVTVPTSALPSPPTYRVFAVVDTNGAVAETNETNNQAVSPNPLTLIGPDLEVATLTAGSFAFRGLPYPVSTLVRNNGAATAHDFTVCFVISRNLLISIISDPILTTTPPMTLEPGQSIALNLEPVIPTTTGTGAWYLGAVADCSAMVNEGVETNNVKRRGDPITIRDPAPDFVPVDIATATVAAAGESLPVTTRIANLGNAPGSTHVRLVLSTNAGISLDDPTIYDTAQPIDLSPPGEATLSVWAMVPNNVTSGTYYVGAIVDPTNAVDEVYEDNNALGAGPVVIIGGDLAIITPPPPNAVVGVPYVRRFAAVGGTAPHVWSFAWKNLLAPQGLSFNPATAELSGTPAASAEGRYDLTVTVTSGSLSASRDYALIVTLPTLALSVVSSRLPPALSGESYTVQLVAVGGTPPYTWTLTSPPVSIDVSSTGELGGEPATIGAYNFMARVVDIGGATAEAMLSLDVVDASSSITIVTAEIPTGVVGSEYDTTFAASGGTPPYTWRLDAGAIPGITFDAPAAQLVGTPTVAGAYPLIAEVRDANGLVDRNAFVLDIYEIDQLRIITGQDPANELPAGKIGAAYVNSDGSPVRFRAVRSGGSDLSDVRWMVTLAHLPPGLGLDPTTGLVLGEPTTGGVFAFSVTARDATNDTDSAALAIRIEDATGSGATGPEDRCSCTATRREGRRGPWGSLFLIVAFGGMLLSSRARGLRSRVAALPFALGLGLGLGLVGPTTAEAQPIPYLVLEASEPYVPLTGATEIVPGLADGGFQVIPIPFEFYLYGIPYNTITVNANGLVAVTNIGAGNHYPPDTTPNVAPPNGFIAGLWADWCASGGSCGSATPNPGIGVFYRIDSTPGDGQLHIEYRSIQHYGDSAAASNVTFTITLHEGLSSQIDLHYGPITAGTNFSGDPIEFNARIGIENATATAGMWLAPCPVGSSPCTSAQAASLTDHKITVIADAGDDVTMSSVAVPFVGYPGLPFSVAARLTSRHMEALGPTRVVAYLVPTTATSTQGGRLGWTSGPITLAGFESRLLTFDLEVPDNVPVGYYKVAVVADAFDELAETGEDNNVALSSQSVRIADRAPDFRIVSVRPLATTLAPGASLSVAYRAENFGNEPGTLELMPVISRNKAITQNDPALGPRLGIATTPRQSFTGTITAVVPASTVTGTYYVGLIADPDLAVAELNEANNVGLSGTTVVVSASQVEFLTEELPPATLSQGYSAALRAAGGDGGFSFTHTDGTLPRGVSFNAATADLHGIPLESGSFPLEFEVSSGATMARKSMNLEVLDPSMPLTIVTRSLPPAVLGSDYAVELKAVGGSGTYSWRILGGAMPEGLLLASDGTVLGLPATSGFAAFSVEVKDNASVTAIVSLSLQVVPPGNLTIVSSSLPDAKLDETYSQQLFAVGGLAPLAWNLLASPVPPGGLSLSADGILSGVPERIGTYHFQAGVQDARGNLDKNLLTLVVVPSGHFDIVTTSLPEGRSGEMYRVLMKASGGRTPYDWKIVAGEGTLPTGFDSHVSDGVAEGETSNDFVISGTLPREGIWTFTVRATDAQGRMAARPVALVSNAVAGGGAVSSSPEDTSRCNCTSAHRRTTEDFGMLGSLGLLFALSAIRRKW